MERAPVSFQRFAREMRGLDRVFAERVGCFEAVHGRLDDDGLAVAARANYLCWFEAEFPSSLLRAGQAIASGIPRPMNLCRQISTARWRDLHHYVVAVQQWLGDTRPAPDTLTSERLTALRELLGEPTPVRVALGRLYLSTLVEDVLDTSFGELSDDDRTDGGQYEDYSAWYRRPDGHLYRQDRGDALVQDWSRCVRQGMADRPGEAEDLLKHLGDPDRPSCAQRYPRYQEIRLASIGALKWRGNLPADVSPRGYWEELFRDAGDGTGQWVAGAPATTSLGRRIHEALGPPDSRKLDLVSTCLIPPPGSSRAFDWLERTAVESGLTAGTALRRMP